MSTDQQFHTVRGYQLLNAEGRVLTSGMEDYLEMIYRICLEAGFVRISQLAERLSVRPSSATKVVQKLSDLGLVDYEKYGRITLTEHGGHLGEFLYARHKTIQEFLGNLGITERLLQDTELIEHDVSYSTLEYIQVFNQFFADYPEIKEHYFDYLRHKLKQNK